MLRTKLLKTVWVDIKKEDKSLRESAAEICATTVEGRFLATR